MTSPTFIDLFAGLGGFRIGLEKNGFRCVYGSDFNKHAAQIYATNFEEDIFSDVTKVDVSKIPDFDILCGGFPCQPFSKAGTGLGFEDTRGTVFFDLCRIIEHKKPSVIFLENVKNLTTHDGGNTFKVIVEDLQKLGYTVTYKVLNAADFGVPQSRERIIIVANNKGIQFDFSKIPTVSKGKLEYFLDDKPDEQFDWLDTNQYTLIDETLRKTSTRTGLQFVGYRNKNTRLSGVVEGNNHHSRTHKQQNRIYSAKGTYSTLSASEKAGRYYILANKKDGSEGVRKLTLSECFRIFGYPESYIRVGPLSEQYARIGNSICVPMVEAVGTQIKAQLF